MGFMSWLTGRDAKESDVYLDEAKVDQVVSSIKSIGTGEVESARDAVHAAINELNNVNGVAQYVGSVEPGAFDGVFDSVVSAISQIGEQIQSKANDIKTYEESAWYEKLGSTFAMAGAKFGEGILSVAEDLGDGVVSVVGWVAPKDSGVEKWCGKFVEKNWSHDAFNFYYNSEFAKKSAFTEDSAAASAFKLAGSTTGYLALGGFASGAGSVVATKTLGATSKVGKAAHAVGTFMSSTTKVNTLTAGLSGMGSGTESALKQGLSFDEAAWSGAKQGAVQAGMAYGMGKLGERNAKKQAVQAAQDKADDAAAAVKEAKDVVKSSKNAKAMAHSDLEAGTPLSAGEFDQAANNLTKAKAGLKTAKSNLTEANKTLETVKNSKLSSYQGYNDGITKMGQKAGEKYATSVANNGFIRTTIGTPLKAAGSVAATGGKTAVKGVKAVGSTVRHPVQTAKSAFNATKTAASNGKSAIKTTASTLKTGAGNAKTAVVNAVKSPNKIQTMTNAGKTALSTTKNAIKSAPGAALKVTGAALRNPEIPGIMSASATAELRNIAENRGNAATQFKKNTPKLENVPNDVTNITGNGGSIGAKPMINGGNSGNKPNNSTNTGGSSSGGGGSRSGGGGGGGSTGGGYTPTSTASTNPGNGSEQFKKTKTVTDNSKTPEKKPTTTPTETKKPTTPTTTPTTPTKPTTPTNPSNPTTPTNPSNQTATPTTPGNNNNVVATQPSNPGTGQTTQHTGGGYSGSGGYRGYTGGGNSGVSGTGVESVTETASVEDVISETKTSIDDVIKGSKYTKIPTSSKPITATTSGSGGSAAIPIVAGLSAAASAGIGAKVYMDRKKNNENGEYDEIETEDWSGEDTLNLDYDDSSDTETYLNEDDDYSYQAEEQTEKYDARNNEELADLQ